MRNKKSKAKKIVKAELHGVAPENAKPGVCWICGCTDGEGCAIGCAWANKRRTVCTACDAVSHRIGARGDKALFSPIYALWVLDGGPNSDGHWLLNTDDDRCDDHPAVYYDLKRAKAACAHENDPKEGIAACGWCCIVVELKAVAIFTMDAKARTILDGRKPK